MTLVEGMIEDMNTCASEICVLRKKTDRAFNAWYSQSKDLDEFVAKYKGDKAVLETYILMNKEETHFYKKQKTL